VIQKKRDDRGQVTTTVLAPSSPPRLTPARGNRQARAAAALALIGVGALAVAALWWHDTPSFTGLGGWLTNAGRITGLLAGYAIAILLVLMSRAPFLERGLGTDTLTRWHAHGGRYVVSLIVVHAVLITWGYAVIAHTNVVSESRTLLGSYPDVLMATVAGLLLVAIGAVSARAARSKLRYETWYYLHLYTYLAIALAFSHQFSTGADFVSNLPARVAWSALYIAAGALVAWYRFVAPIRAAARHRLRVIEVVRESPDTVSITIGGDRLDELGAESGHFFRWRFLTRDDWWQSHPYSLSAPPDWRSLRITVKDLGDHSQQLQHVHVGTRVLAEGPYGALTARQRRRRRVLLIAGGVGITPLRALFESLPAQPGDLTLIVRANRPEEVVFAAELDAIAARRGATVHYLIGLPGSATDPFVGSRLRSLVPDLARHDVYLCGPPRFMTAAAERVRASGVPARHLHREHFTF
jgi:predicted ferric reductase